MLSGGTEEQKKTILPKIVAGDTAAIAVIERDGKWDLTQTKNSAKATKNGYELSGEKFFVCNADCADWFLISAQLEGSLAVFIASQSDMASAKTTRESVIDETKRSYRILLDGVALPATALLEKEKAFQTLKQIQQVGFLLSAAESCGGTIAIIEYTVDYLKTRKQFGKLIGSYQALKHPTVDAFVQYEQARSHLYSAANCFGDQGNGEIATSMAKAQADTAFSYASDRAIQFHGGFGFTYECDAQLYRRRAAWHAALFGDAPYHRKRLAHLLF